jgi:hypothetical protein
MSRLNMRENPSFSKNYIMNSSKKRSFCSSITLSGKIWQNLDTISRKYATYKLLEFLPIAKFYILSIKRRILSKPPKRKSFKMINKRKKKSFRDLSLLVSNERRR